MKQFNIYKFVSGGYIFDLMDRKAQEYAIYLNGNNNDYLMTKSAEVEYLRQCCDKKDLRVSTGYSKRNNDEYSINVWATSLDGITVYAHARFVFVAKTHNFCELKG